MRKHLSSIAVLFVMVLVGCEASPYPLSIPGDAPVRSELLGNWTATDEDGAELALSLLKFNEFEYLAIVKTPDEDGPTLFRMYESDVDGLQFANIQCLDCDDEDKEYLFARLAIEGDVMHTEWLDDAFYESMDVPESAEDVLRALVEAKRNDRMLYSEEWEWTRAQN